MPRSAAPVTTACASGSGVTAATLWAASLLRVWVRLHCRASAPSEDDLAREVHRYALPRLPAQTEPPPPAPAEPAYAMAGGPLSGSSSGIIEID